MTWVYLFFIGTVFDLLYVLWMSACERRKPHLAGILGVLIALCSFLGVQGALEDPMNLVPYLSGLYLGSYLGVRLKK